MRRVVKKILRTFQTIWKTSANLVLLDDDVGGYLGGGQNQLFQKWIFLDSARAARFWRAPSF